MAPPSAATTRSRPTSRGASRCWPPRPTCSRPRRLLAGGHVPQRGDRCLPQRRAGIGGRRAARHRRPRRRSAGVLGGKWFKVVGILDPRTARSGHRPLGDDRLRRRQAALRRRRRAVDGAGAHDPDHTDEVWSVLAATANPKTPTRSTSAVRAMPSRPRRRPTRPDRAAARLGAVALLVGGGRHRHFMVISVLERRAEIGCAPARGATRRHIRLQSSSSRCCWPASAVPPRGLRAAITAVYANARDWMFAIPQTALLAGWRHRCWWVALAGIYPAARASRLAPAEAFRAE